MDWLWSVFGASRQDAFRVDVCSINSFPFVRLPLLRYFKHAFQEFQIPFTLFYGKISVVPVLLPNPTLSFPLQIGIEPLRKDTRPSSLQ